MLEKYKSLSLQKLYFVIFSKILTLYHSFGHEKTVNVCMIDSRKLNQILKIYELFRGYFLSVYE